jgi:hypothetical protein
VTAQSQPVTQAAQPDPVPEGEYQFEIEIETMRRNALKLVAALQAEDEQSASLEPPTPAVPAISPREHAL